MKCWHRLQPGWSLRRVGWVREANHKRRLLLGRKAITTNPDSVLKSRDHHFADKGSYSQSYGFSSCRGWMWELEHEEAEWWRTDAFKLWCWGSLLRVPWTARRSNQSILKEISPEYSLEGHCRSWNSNTLPPDVKTQQIGKVPDAGKDWGEEEKGTTEGEMVGWHHRFNGREFWANSGR